MYTGEIITVAIILPDSLSPVKNPSNILDFGHDFDLALSYGEIDNEYEAHEAEVILWNCDANLKSAKRAE